MRNSDPPSNFTPIGVLRGRFDGWILLSENYCNVKNTIFPRSEIFQIFPRKSPTWILSETIRNPSENAPNAFFECKNQIFINLVITHILVFDPDQKCQNFRKFSKFLIWRSRWWTEIFFFIANEKYYNCTAFLKVWEANSKIWGFWWLLKGYVKSSPLREVKFTDFSYFNELGHEIYRECCSFPYFSNEIKKKIQLTSWHVQIRNFEILWIFKFLIWKCGFEIHDMTKIMPKWKVW